MLPQISCVAEIARKYSRKIGHLEDQMHLAHGNPAPSKPFVCQMPHCDRAYRSRNSLYYHRRANHGNSADASSDVPSAQVEREDSVALIPRPLAEKFKCEKTFSNRRSADYLARVHFIPLNVQCTRCEQCFRLLRDMELHRHLEHNGPAPFKLTGPQCPVAYCPWKYFDALADVRGHFEENHEEDWPYRKPA